MRRTYLLLILLLITRIPEACAVVSVLHHFGESDIAPRNAQNPLVAHNGWLIGTSSDGGQNDAGTIYRLRTNGTGFEVFHNFDDPFASPNSGSFPLGSLKVYGGNLIGFANGGGASDEGNLYRINPSNLQHQVLHSFDSFDDLVGVPTGAIAVSASRIFGGASLGDFDSAGALFSMNPDGSDVQPLRQFPASGADGLGLESLILASNSIFGTLSSGGDHGQGVLFRIEQNGSNFQVLHDFVGKTAAVADGSDPSGDLLQVGSRLIGVTQSGGQSDLGTVYSIGLDGTDYRILHQFNGLDGWSPESGLTQFGDRIYGVTSRGGKHGEGSIFSLTTSGTAFKVHHYFSDLDGQTPTSQLLAVDGKLVGTTLGGGAYDAGIVFSLAPGIPQGDYDLDGDVDGADFLEWQRGFGSTSNLAADGNQDNVVDAADYVVWRDNFAIVPQTNGDYDADGDVDGSDFLAWQRGFGSTTNLAADGNRNGIVDAADYTIWRDNFGAGPSTTVAVSAIPEPSAVVLCCTALLLSIPLCKKQTSLLL